MRAISIFVSREAYRGMCKYILHVKNNICIFIHCRLRESKKTEARHKLKKKTQIADVVYVRVGSSPFFFVSFMQMEVCACVRWMIFFKSKGRFRPMVIYMV